MVDEIVYRCGVCQSEFADMDQCQQHLALHNTSSEPIGTIVTDTEVWRCPFCDLDLKTSSDCQVHIIEQHSDAATVLQQEYDTTLANSLDNETLTQIETTVIQDALPNSNDTERDEIASANSEAYKLIDIVLDRHEGAIFGCENCGEVFQSEKNVVSHIKNAHGNEPTEYVTLTGSDFVCDICNLSLNSQVELDSHRSTIHTKQFTCTDCNATFTSQSEYQSHCDAAKSPTRMCETCNLPYCNEEHRKKHLRSHGIADGKDDVTREIAISITRLDANIPCPDCDKMLKSQRALNSHWAAMHKTSNEVYQCQCGKEFKDAYKLRNHKRVHSGERPFSCEECRASFTDRSALISHARLHTGQKRYACPQPGCFKEFAQSSNLRIHMRRHSGEKPLHCQVCDQSFTYRSQLDRHMVTHTGIMPYTCDQCGKGFAQLGNLNVHKRIHTGKKPYVCDICDLRFTYKAGLVTHSEAHTGEKPYKCFSCGKGFCQRSGLNAHTRTAHQNRTPSVPICIDCNLGFSSNDAYASHMKFKHSVKINITTLESHTGQ